MRTVALLASVACLCACAEETVEPAGEANADSDSDSDSGDASLGDEADDDSSSSEDGSDEPPYRCDYSMFEEIEPLWTTKAETFGPTLELTDSAIIMAGPRYVDGVATDEGHIERRSFDGALEWLVTVPGLMHWSSADTDHLYYWDEKTHRVHRRSLQDGAGDSWTTDVVTLNRINAVGEHVVVSRGQEFVWYEKLTGEPVGAFHWTVPPWEDTAYGNIIAPMPDEGYLVGVRTGYFAVHRLMGIAGFSMDTTLDIEGYQPAVLFTFPRPEGIWIGTTAGLRGVESESMVMLLSDDGREQWRKPIEPCGSLAGVDLSTSFAQTEDGLLGIATLTTYSEEDIHFVELQDVVIRLDWTGELTDAYRVKLPPPAEQGRVPRVGRLSHREGMTVVAFTNGGRGADLELYLAQLDL